MGQEAGADHGSATYSGVLSGEPALLAIWVLLRWEYVGESWGVAC